MRLFKRILLILPVLFLVLTCSKDDDPEMFVLSVTITPEEGGSVSPDGGAFDDGAMVTLTGTPSEGYIFKEWMGDLKSTENPISVSMNSDMNVTLVFVKSDGDNDGVPDDLDDCLNTPQGEDVDANGCSASQTDTDGDGVFDSTDTCPDTPQGEDVDETGCSDSQKDTDGDGVTDNIDDCPNTPEGEDVNEEGCPLSPPIYLDENGVTIKAYEWSQVGQTGIINGVVYTIVDESMLREMVENGADVTRVCTSKVDKMSGLFFQKFSFNQDISSWDVSSVIDMSQMFSGDIMSGIQSSFNQDISLWDVSNVTNMRLMFHSSVFNEPIGNWDVGKVTNMDGMFSFSSFNQDLASWDVSNVGNMSGMFASSRFNQPIGNWDVSNVTDMSNMFFYVPFNQPIGNWNVSNVIDMSQMFAYSAFNQDINSWDVSNVTNMSGMFNNVDIWVELDPNPFNQDISSWNVSSVSDMSFMFANSSFNQDLSTWNVENVTTCHAFNMSSYDWTLPKPDFTNCDPG